MRKRGDIASSTLVSFSSETFYFYAGLAFLVVSLPLLEVFIWAATYAQAFSGAPPLVASRAAFGIVGRWRAPAWRGHGVVRGRRSEGLGLGCLKKEKNQD